jgi:hypothetical protein
LPREGKGKAKNIVVQRNPKSQFLQTQLNGFLFSPHDEKKKEEKNTGKKRD